MPFSTNLQPLRAYQRITRNSRSVQTTSYFRDDRRFYFTLPASSTESFHLFVFNVCICLEGFKGDKSQWDPRCILCPMKSYIYILEYKESLVSKREDWITEFGDQWMKIDPSWRPWTVMASRHCGHIPCLTPPFSHELCTAFEQVKPGHSENFREVDYKYDLMFVWFFQWNQNFLMCRVRCRRHHWDLMMSTTPNPISVTQHNLPSLCYQTGCDPSGSCSCPALGEKFPR